MDHTGQNIIVLDLETAHSADDCRHCGTAEPEHAIHGYCSAPSIRGGFTGTGATYQMFGWDNKAALGLSIGCFFSYCDSRIHWFDVHTLAETIDELVGRQPLLISFNGRQFDGPLMEAVFFASLAGAARGGRLLPWQTLWERSYDILAEIWKVDPDSQFVHGLNSLDAISRANGFGGKLSRGAEAPRRWARGEYADVLNYVQDDVYKTRALFQLICDGQPILRGNGLPLHLPIPAGMESAEDARKTSTTG